MEEDSLGEVELPGYLLFAGFGDELGIWKRYDGELVAAEPAKKSAKEEVCGMNPIYLSSVKTSTVTINR